MKPISNLLVVGGGTDALLSAFALRRLTPYLGVRLLLTGPPDEDPAGESTTPLIIQFLCRTLGLGGNDIHNLARPTWTLGAKLLWGARGSFFRAYDATWGNASPDLKTGPGFLAAKEGLDGASLATALMEAGKLFPKDGAHGVKPIENVTGFNFRAAPLGRLLRRAAMAAGVEIVDGEIASIQRGEAGIDSIRLADGREFSADLYIDASGTRAALTDSAFVSYPSTRTRAATMLRRRGSEPIRPFVTIETLDAGWRWRIEHDDAVGVGIAWDPEFLDDAAARELLLGKVSDPLEGPRFVTWNPGRREEAWHRGVVAIGDAGGFVEPLTSMRMANICLQLHLLKQAIDESDRMPGPETIRAFNRAVAGTWDEMRAFVALHERFNSAGNSHHWQSAKERADLGDFEELAALYERIGPSPHLVNCLPQWPGAVGIDGWIGALLGLGVPFNAVEPDPESRRLWRSHVERNRHNARQAVAQELCLAAVRRQAQPQKPWGAGI